MHEMDMIIQGCLVYDGMGSSPYLADIEIKEGKIATIGDIRPDLATNVISGKGQCLAPGFIDAHTHDESFFFDTADPLAKVSQGVTYEFVGICGKSLSPLTSTSAPLLKNYLGPALAGAKTSFDWRTWGEFKSTYTKPDGNFSITSFTGHGSIRLAVMGFENRSPTPAELKQMECLLVTELESGTAGLSLGLSYPPGSYADLPELCALGSVAARYGKPVVSHLRSESDQLIEAVAEMIEVTRHSGCRMIISHHKAAGRRNYGKIQQTFEMIENARLEGLEIVFDVYPYTAGNTSITALVPPWALEGGITKLMGRLQSKTDQTRMRREIEEDGSWENLVRAAGWQGLVVSSIPSYPELEGLTLEQVSNQKCVDPCTALFQLLIETQGQCRVIVMDMDEQDVEFLVQASLSQIISDSTDVIGKPHPRLYGAFTRVLGRYAREKENLKLEDAIHKMTYGPAHRYQLEQRGAIKPGYVADLVIFDADEVGDTATYSQPRSYSNGISYVISNGKILMDHSKQMQEIVVTSV